MPGTVVKEVMLAGATAPGLGTKVMGLTNKRTFSVSGSTTSGTGAATIDVKGRMAGMAWQSLLSTPISLALGTTVTGDSFTDDSRYEQYVMEVLTISGTGASIDGVMGY